MVVAFTFKGAALRDFTAKLNVIGARRFGRGDGR
jgi:hypothetical protein